MYYPYYSPPPPPPPTPVGPPKVTPCPPAPALPPVAKPPKAPIYPPVPSMPPTTPPPKSPPTYPPKSPMHPPLVSPFYSPNIVTPPDGGGGHTTIIIVCVSLGSVFFLAFLAAGLFCLAKRRHKPVMPPAPCPPPVTVHEHESIHETVVTCPGGVQTTTIDIDDDIIIGTAGGAIAGAAAGCGGRGSPSEPRRAGPVATPPQHPHNC